MDWHKFKTTHQPFSWIFFNFLKINRRRQFIFQFMTSSSGTNFIGIMPGEYWGSPHDKPIIVGAHWDSVSTSPGYNDNGSGAAALLVTIFPHFSIAIFSIFYH